MNLFEDKFIPSEEWVKNKYDEANKLYFGGSLGKCDFLVEEFGNAKVCGTFSLTAKGIGARKTDRKIIAQVNNVYVYVDTNNFYSLCKPLIRINKSILGKEENVLNTLVHEMCHYYTYKDGVCPKKSHGEEFKRIADIVYMKSNGKLNIEEKADKNEVYEKSEELLKKEAVKISKMKVFVGVLDSNQTFALVPSFSEKQYEKHMYHWMTNANVKTIFNIVDNHTLTRLYNNGFRSSLRNLGSYYEFNADNMRKLLKDCEYHIVKGDNSFLYSLQDKKEANNRPFCISTNKGKVTIVYKNREDLIMKLKERFPKWSDETIDRIISNDANYINEAKTIIDKIILDEIKNFTKRVKKHEMNDTSIIEITPRMNLSDSVPFELE